MKMEYGTTDVQHTDQKTFWFLADNPDRAVQATAQIATLVGSGECALEVTVTSDGCRSLIQFDCYGNEDQLNSISFGFINWCWCNNLLNSLIE